MGLLPAFGIFGAAVFAEPAIADVEEVICLVHGAGTGARSQLSGAGYQVSGVRHAPWLQPAPDTRHPFFTAFVVFPAFLSGARALKCDDHCAQFAPELAHL